MVRVWQWFTVAVTLIFVAGTPAAHGMKVISDGEFAVTDWDHSTLYSVPVAGFGPMVHVAVGGNPGAYQQGEHHTDTIGALIYDGHVFTGDEFDPGALGDLLSIDISYDYLDISGGGTENGLLVRQAGAFYILLVDDTGPHATWTPLGVSGITEDHAGWSEISSNGLAAGSPDFSSNGATLEFGYYTFNEYPPVRGGGGGGFVQEWGIDNFTVTICSEERCNGQDDDCDSLVDEGFGVLGPVDSNGVLKVELIPVGENCGLGEGDCAAIGRVVCVSNGLSAECDGVVPPPGVEGPYLDPTCCDYHDNDCDGLLDYEDPDCTGAEVCDFCDNDDDGQVDEDFPELGDTCTTGVGVCKAVGEMVCTEDGLGTTCSAVPYPGFPEGPPCSPWCEDGIDNDCDGLIDLLDPDCQEPERCDGKDNDGDGSIDEDFPDIGELCFVGEGQCAAAGLIICNALGDATTCGASPGKGSPEGPVGCDCADGIDNDCDGLIDIDDPDCGGSQLRASCALPTTCVPAGTNGCESWHTVEFDTTGGTGTPTVVAELVGLDTNGMVIASITVDEGDAVRMASRLAAGDFKASTTDVLLDLDFFAGWDGCVTGPNGGPLFAGCEPYDNDCDGDADLEDWAAFQEKSGQTLKYHEMFAPTPLLRVQANDGLRDAVAYCSNVPYLAVTEPDNTVVSISEGDRTFVRAAIPQVDPTTLFVKIDGVDILTGLGIDPVTDFPGGPFGGQVQINDCLAEVCDLVVDAAPNDSPAANTLTMYVENLCCGGHVVVVQGDKWPGSFPDNPDPACHVDDLRGKGISHGFEVTLVTPQDGQLVPAGPTDVAGAVCHGLELECPFPTVCPPQVKINGAYVALVGPALTPGDGEDSADKYEYSFSSSRPMTDMVQDIAGTGIFGTFDPGMNRCIVEATDPLLNTTYANAFFAVGDVNPVPSGSRGGTAIDKAINLALTATGLQTVVSTLLDGVVPDLVDQTIRQLLTEANGQKFEYQVTNNCEPTITITVDLGSYSFDTEAFGYSIIPSDNQVDGTISAPDASVDGGIGGHCKVDVCSAIFPDLCFCWINLSVNVSISVDVTGVEVDFVLTEDDVLNSAAIVPTITLNNNNIDLDIPDIDIAAGCIGGFILHLINLFVPVEDVLVVVLNWYVDNYLDVTQWFNMINLPAMQVDLFELDPVELANLNVLLEFEKSLVEMDSNGMTVGFETTFTPTETNAEVADIPGTPQTDAPLPQPVIPLALDVAVALSDDAVNQLFYATTVSGGIITEYEDVRPLSALLPADCSTLPDLEYGACEGFKGTNCLTLPGGMAMDSCFAASILSAQLNIDSGTLLLLHGRADAPPKLFLDDDDLTLSTVETVLRLSQLSVGLVADRDGDGLFSEDYDTVPSCFAANPATETECSIWESCMDINFFTDLSLTMDGDVPVINTTVVSSALSTGEMCNGGMQGPGEDVFDEIAQGLVLNLLTQLVSDNTPPLRLEGLDFGGEISLQNAKLIAIENNGAADFDDYLAITAEPVP